MTNLSFAFDIKASFRGYPSHPITVPRGEIDYKHLESERLHEGDFILILPRGERFVARMAHGHAGYGPYYQLKFVGDDRRLPEYLGKGTRVYVFLVRMRDSNYAIIEMAA
jgi:hypothetical protein